MKDTKYSISQLTLSLEIIAHSMPVVLLVYFIMIGGNYANALQVYLTAVSVGAAANLILAVVMRWVKLRRVFAILNDDDPHDEQTLHDCKLKLLNHPRFEAKSMLIRYPVGVWIAILGVAVGGEMNELRFIVSNIAMLMLIPITAAFFMFQSELSLSRILK